MGVDDLATDGQTEAGAACVAARGAALDELVEYGVELFTGDADTFIRDDELKQLVRLLGSTSGMLELDAFDGAHTHDLH